MHGGLQLFIFEKHVFVEHPSEHSLGITNMLVFKFG